MEWWVWMCIHVVCWEIWWQDGEMRAGWGLGTTWWSCCPLEVEGCEMEAGLSGLSAFLLVRCTYSWRGTWSVGRALTSCLVHLPDCCFSQSVDCQYSSRRSFAWFCYCHGFFPRIKFGRFSKQGQYKICRAIWYSVSSHSLQRNFAIQGRYIYIYGALLYR